MICLGWSNFPSWQLTTARLVLWITEVKPERQFESGENNANTGEPANTTPQHSTASATVVENIIDVAPVTVARLVNVLVLFRPGILHFYLCPIHPPSPCYAVPEVYPASVWIPSPPASISSRPARMRAWSGANQPRNMQIKKKWENKTFVPRGQFSSGDNWFRPRFPGICRTVSFRWEIPSQWGERRGVRPGV